MIENIVGKWKVAYHEHDLIFPQCFQTLSAADTSKHVYDTDGWAPPILYGKNRFSNGKGI